MNNNTNKTSIQSYFEAQQSTLAVLAEACTKLEAAATIFSSWDKISQDQCAVVLPLFESMKQEANHMLALYEWDAMPSSLLAFRHQGLIRWDTQIRKITKVTVAAVSYQEVCTSMSEDVLDQRARLSECIGQLIAAIRGASKTTVLWHTTEVSKSQVIASKVEHVSEDEKMMDITQALPPALPSWFLTLDIPQPLLGLNDSRWIVKARRNDPDNPEVGILIYEDHAEFVFMIDEEAVRAARYIQTQQLKIQHQQEGDHE